MLFKYNNSLNKQTSFDWPLGHITNTSVEKEIIYDDTDGELQEESSKDKQENAS